MADKIVDEVDRNHVDEVGGNIVNEVGGNGVVMVLADGVVMVLADGIAKTHVSDVLAAVVNAADIVAKVVADILADAVADDVLAEAIVISQRGANAGISQGGAFGVAIVLANVNSKCGPGMHESCREVAVVSLVVGGELSMTPDTMAHPHNCLD